MNDHLDANASRLTSAEKEFEKALRPLSFGEFSGQGKVVENLEIFVAAAKQRTEALTMFCCMALRDWGKRRSRISSPTNLA